MPQWLEPLEKQSRTLRCAVTEDITRHAPDNMGALPAPVTLLLAALSQHDGLTYLHSLRVGRRAWQISYALGAEEAHVWSSFLSGLLHDVGKIFLPKSLLQKAGILSRAEWRMIYKHPLESVRLLRFFPELSQFRASVVAHHERPDGQGYPHGVQLADIPGEALVLAVADAIEAMSTRRPYALPRSEEEIRAILLEGAGTCWDAHIAELAAQQLVLQPVFAPPTPATDLELQPRVPAWAALAS